MKNENRKRVLPLDYIKQKQNQQQESRQSKNKGKKSSGGSSDFSQFELESKDNNTIFKPFKKPKFWKNQSDVSRSVQKLQPKNRQENHTRKTKKRKENRQQTKKSVKFEEEKDKKENKNLHTVSFKRNQAHEPNFFQNIENKSEVRPKQKSKRQQSQQLITQYDKKDFTNKSPERQAYNHQKQLTNERSNQRSSRRKPQQAADEGEQGMKQTSGGVCFDVTVSDFVREQEKSKRNRKKKHRRNSTVVDINSKQQILKRRQIAFRYGQFARRRTFGYY